MSALRLLHCTGSTDDPEAQSLETAIDRWRRVLYGQEEALSKPQEDAWRATLATICAQIAHKARAALQIMGDKPRGTRSEARWTGWMENNIEMLWREELEVAEAVARSVEAGIEF